MSKQSSCSTACRIGGEHTSAFSIKMEFTHDCSMEDVIGLDQMEWSYSILISELILSSGRGRPDFAQPECQSVQLSPGRPGHGEFIG